MSAAVLLESLRSRGVILSADGDQIKYRAPRGTMTPDLRQALADRKGELLALLSEQQSGPKPSLLSQNIITVYAREWPDSCPLCESSVPCRKQAELYRCLACGWRFIWRQIERMQ